MDTVSAFTKTLMQYPPGGGGIPHDRPPPLGGGGVTTKVGRVFKRARGGGAGAVMIGHGD